MNTLITVTAVLAGWWWLATKVLRIPEKVKHNKRPPLM